MSDETIRPSVLIVDDSPSNIATLGELLRQDYRVSVATNGTKALQIAASESPPDAILLDVMMPGIDGYEVCRRLNADPVTRKIPVLFITARSEDDDEATGFQLGAVDYIRKPFNPVVVRARVRTHIELKQKRDILESMSFRDGLTGIANRRYFDERYSLLWDVAAREVSPLAIVMVDVDHFKLFNDNYGHTEGDACLVRVAQSLTRTVKRKTDLVARYGGEEFIGVFLKTNSDDAWRIAEAMRQEVLAESIPHGHSPTDQNVTVSLGLVSLVPTSVDQPERLLARADKALYQAKERGRNRSVIG